MVPVPTKTLREKIQTESWSKIVQNLVWYSEEEEFRCRQEDPVKGAWKDILGKGNREVAVKGQAEVRVRRNWFGSIASGRSTGRSSYSVEMERKLPQQLRQQQQLQHNEGRTALRHACKTHAHTWSRRGHFSRDPSTHRSIGDRAAIQSGRLRGRRRSGADRRTA